MNQIVSLPDPPPPHWVASLLARPWVYILISAAILLLDYATGRFLMFPILFVIPVALSAWFYSGRCAMALAVLLPIGRLCIAQFVEQSPSTVAVVVNTLTRIGVLVFMAYLVSRTARQAKALEREVSLLEGILHICMHCKRIRDDGQGWQPIEGYISQHAEVDFSHGLCPECAQQHYGHLSKRNAA